MTEFPFIAVVNGFSIGAITCDDVF